MSLFRFAPAFVLGAILVVNPGVAQAQSNDNPDNPECLGDSCGRPQEEGGGCGCGCGGSVWVNYTDDGDTLSYTDDADGDGRADDRDNCPFVSNRDQTDTDGDGVGNACDNCPSQSNFQQRDADGDGIGDDCDPDQDNDGVENARDNCPLIPNTDQSDLDADGLGDVCDQDDDNDGVPDGSDNCPRVFNPDQVMPADASQCRVDADGDNISDNADNCPGLANPDQKDTDNDGLGDACDPDIDNDSILNDADNCKEVANRDQSDDDRDGIGDACDTLYCLVVDKSNPADCLNPKSPFTVSAGGHRAEKQTGIAIRPALFANRNGAAMEYKWSVTKRPEGSNAVVESPQGAVTLSRNWEYVYVDGNVPHFVPDKKGTYELTVEARLAFADRVFPDHRVSTSTLVVAVGEEGEDGSNCNSVPAGFSATAFGAALLGMLLRRRRSEQ
ncbi:thrombospondin type 3 repeat-containing protein [Myxococcus sp. K15C18031901]|uniref:cell-cell cohesion MYXO-CTERM protein MtsC n=1 Tax=Myxococcus dinghuensis TaxID=2906761 RepID=UPI0020A6F894|nr:thrombospondin type 3 repeat-containing protein [Myxococcus dinghuensis]MCP3105041.1 thrombospondin type 3 repeat-containing protein [Myxococcus dinghuensis]